MSKRPEILESLHTWTPPSVDSRHPSCFGICYSRWDTSLNAPQAYSLELIRKCSHREFQLPFICGSSILLLTSSSARKESYPHCHIWSSWGVLMAKIFFPPLDTGQRHSSPRLDKTPVRNYMLPITFSWLYYSQCDRVNKVAWLILHQFPTFRFVSFHPFTFMLFSLL